MRILPGRKPRISFTVASCAVYGTVRITISAFPPLQRYPKPIASAPSLLSSAVTRTPFADLAYR